MQDERILPLFFSRSEQAIHEVDQKYGDGLLRFAMRLLGNRQDAEECVNDAYLGAWNTIPPAKPDPLAAYLYRLVRNLACKRYHRETAARRDCRYTVAMQELESCLSAPDSVEDMVQVQELTHLIESFLETLDIENRVIFLRRYWFCDSYAEIAARVGLREKTVSVRLVRLRRKLKLILQEKGGLE